MSLGLVVLAAIPASRRVFDDAIMDPWRINLAQSRSLPFVGLRRL